MPNPFIFISEIRMMNEEITSRLDQIIDRLDQLLDSEKQKEWALNGDGK